MQSHLEDRRWERAHRVYEAANVILTRPVKGSDLTGWALAVARRAGPRKRVSRWPASWRWCIACSGTEPTSLLIRERQPWRLDREERQDRLSDGHSHQPSAARSLRRTMDGLARYAISSTRDCASKRMANRSSAGPIEQRQSSDCGQKQALGEGLSSQGIDAKPVTDDRIMYRRNLPASDLSAVADRQCVLRRKRFQPEAEIGAAFAQTVSP